MAHVEPGKDANDEILRRFVNTSDWDNDATDDPEYWIGDDDCWDDYDDEDVEP